MATFVNLHPKYNAYDLAVLAHKSIFVILILLINFSLNFRQIETSINFVSNTYF